MAGHDLIDFVGMSLDIAHRGIPGAGDGLELAFALVEHVCPGHQAIDEQARLLRGVG